jgi:hypothetical protein
MPDKPTPLPDEPNWTLSQLEERMSDVLQQFMDQFRQQTFVGGKRVATEKLPPLPEQAATTVHRVKVSLHGAKPPVWRRIEFPSAMRLNRVHEVMQAAFDWHGYHLHVFETASGEFGPPDSDEDWVEREDEATAALAQVAAVEKAKFVYSYNFRADWRLDIVVEKIAPAEPGVAYPRCTGGRRAAPGEGTGTIEYFNEHQADWDNTFDASELTTLLASPAEVLIPAPR